MLCFWRGHWLGLYYNGVNADALWKVEAEAKEEFGLVPFWAADTAQAKFASIDQGQDDVSGLDGGERREGLSG